MRDRKKLQNYTAMRPDAGAVVGPLLDRQGFTIIKPIKIELGPTPPLDDKLRGVIEERVRRKKTSVQYDRWIESKRKRAMIVLND